LLNSYEYADGWLRVTVMVNGSWNRDRGKATTYSAAATIFNLNVSGSTGYTDNINIGYTNDTKHLEYVCGNAQLPGAPILWSNDYRGS
jgi:hypothetical protein